jgi:hypothetical protein
MRPMIFRLALASALLSLLSGCYASGAWRQSKRIVRGGFNLEDRGLAIFVTAPGSLLLAGGNLMVASVLPIGGGVDPREPDVKWFRDYDGKMRSGNEVGILCHRDRATWVTGIRSASGGAWRDARHEKWHFPTCIEVLPGRYELEIHYFDREHDDDREQSVTRQAESTTPSRVAWNAQAGGVYLLGVRLGTAQPSQAVPPQRHIPRSRALDTTWWELEESDWYASIERYASWDSLQGPVVEQRRAWMEYEGGRR